MQALLIAASIQQISVSLLYLATHSPASREGRRESHDHYEAFKVVFCTLTAYLWQYCSHKHHRFVIY